MDRPRRPERDPPQARQPADLRSLWEEVCASARWIVPSQRLCVVLAKDGGGARIAARYEQRHLRVRGARGRRRRRGRLDGRGAGGAAPRLVQGAVGRGARGGSRARMAPRGGPRRHLPCADPGLQEDHRHDALRPGRPAPDRPEGAGERDHVRAVRRGHVHDAQELARPPPPRARSCASRTTSSSGSRSSCACSSTGSARRTRRCSRCRRRSSRWGRRAHAARDRHDRHARGRPA